MNNFLFLAVNPDGTEVCSNDYLFRAWDKMKSYSSEEYRKSHPMKDYCENQWMDNVMPTDYGYCGEEYSFDGVILPRGTIEKFLGKKLTWEDEPVAFEF